MEVFRFCRSECVKRRRVVSLAASMPADMFTDIKGYIHSVHPSVYSVPSETTVAKTQCENVLRPGSDVIFNNN